MTIENWKVEGSTYLMRDPWLTVRADTCRTPNGHVIAPYYVLEYPDWVMVALFDSRNRILLNSQYRHAIARVSRELPCGNIDPEDASPEDTARRELLEETGYTADRFEPCGVFSPIAASHSNQVYCFAAFNGRKVAEPKPDPAEEIECEFLEVREIFDLIDRGEFPQILHVSAIMLALRKAGLLTFGGRQA